jgi:hypothetical protein
MAFCPKGRRIPMAAIASAELVAEPERIVRACPARSSGVLRRVADQPAATAGHFDQRQFDVFDEIAGDAPVAEAG